MNNTASEFPGITSMREWMMTVSDGGKYTLNYHPSCLAEVLQMSEKSLKIPKYLGSNGIKCSGHWVGNIVKNGFTIKANGCEFKCYPLGLQKKGVTETSREAYRSLDINAACMEVVSAALESGETYDRALAAKIGRESGYVSARRNDLEKIGRFAFAGKEYAIEYTVKKPCTVTGKRVQWWRVVEVSNGQTSLF